MSPVSCLLSPVSCLLSPVSCLLSCPVLSCPVLSCPFLPSLAMSCHTLPAFMVFPYGVVLIGCLFCFLLFNKAYSPALVSPRLIPSSATLTHVFESNFIEYCGWLPVVRPIQGLWHADCFITSLKPRRGDSWTGELKGFPIMLVPSSKGLYPRLLHGDFFYNKSSLWIRNTWTFNLYWPLRW